MNAKQMMTGLAVLLGVVAAHAVEATQDDPPAASTLTREEVRAETLRAMQQGLLLSGGEATVFVDAPLVASTRTRDEVRAEAIAAMRDNPRGVYYTGG